ncbi:MAG: TIGR00282 family metallophosphoesterase [Mycoplasma sp.]|nr:TIGR00282 family metallophosphoesterase [Mycoplasma sp.]
MKILFIGDIFGKKGKEFVIEHLPSLIKDNNVDFVIAQGENITNRKGLNVNDYNELRNAGVNVFTMGNHVWADKGISDLIKNNENVIRPYNVNKSCPGVGSMIFEVNNKKIRVTSLMGIAFNKLNKPWKQEYSNNFFDAMDEILESSNDDIYIDFVDFHGETTSEKAVFSLHYDGKVDVIVGTHTHVQTSDERILPKGTAFITDAGMTGPKNSAIGANFEEVYKRMRFNERAKFKESMNSAQFNGVLVTKDDDKSMKIKRIKI